MGYSLEQLNALAEHSDVSFRLNYYLCLPDPATKERALQILQKGRKAEALRWLNSVSEEGMRFGTRSKEERLTKARSFAELAGLNITELAREHQLEHLLIEP
jgi:hypothetical protein